MDQLSVANTHHAWHVRMMMQTCHNATRVSSCDLRAPAKFRVRYGIVPYVLASKSLPFLSAHRQRTVSVHTSASTGAQCVDALVVAFHHPKPISICMAGPQAPLFPPMSFSASAQPQSHPARAPALARTDTKHSTYQDHVCSILINRHKAPK